MHPQKYSSYVLPFFFALVLGACDDSGAPVAVGTGGASDGMGGASPDGSKDEDMTSSGGDTNQNGSGGGHSGGGNMGGSTGTTDEEVGDIVLPVADLDGMVNHQLEIELDGEILRDGLTWELVKGVLPEGVTLTSDGWLRGKPVQAGTFQFRLRATGDDFRGIGDVQWEIEGTRWLAYVGSTQDATNLFFLNTALADPTPSPLFSAEHGIKAILAAEFSPTRRYLSVLAQTASGTQAYLIDTSDSDAPSPTPVDEPRSSALFFRSGSELHYGYVVKEEEGATSHIFVNDEKVASFENLWDARFLDETHLVVSTYSDVTNTATVESFDLETKSGNGTMWDGVGPIDLLGPMGGSEGTYVFHVFGPVSVDFYSISVSGSTSYLTSAGEGPITLSSDLVWAARSFPAGAELKNFTKTGSFSLSEYPEFASFSPGSRWFAGIRDVYFTRELVLVDLVQTELSEMVFPETWAEFYGFSSHGNALWAAGMTDDDKFKFLHFGDPGDLLPSVPVASAPGAIVQAQSFDCSPDGAVLLIMGTTEAGHDARRTLQLYDATDLLAAPRDVLTEMPESSLMGNPNFSSHAGFMAFKVSEDAGKNSVYYTKTTYAQAENVPVECGKDLPCKSIGWFQFHQ